MKRTQIAISGIAGSFSEEAAHKFLNTRHIEAEIVYATTARNTFESVNSGATEYGLVPLENSNGGIVLETVHAAADYIGREDITKIVSHHQALAQCKFYLRRHWPAAEHIEYADTALAAKDLAAGSLDRHTAIIASAAAAKLYDLPILEPSIQDLKFNYTSFMAITRHR
jgi:prephenate dehydratase